MPYLDSVASRSRFVITWVSELLNGIIKGLLRPSSTSILIASVVDLTRSKPDLIAENALLRHQLTLLKRQSKRPRLTHGDQDARSVNPRSWRSPSFLIERSEFAESVGACSALVCCVPARRRDARHVRRRPSAATACAAVYRSARLWPAPTRSHTAVSTHRAALSRIS